ncbi:MAG TPA: fatty acyl-AMP ligase, partial [Bryobacterales bacterium]|nr:fatty acyl-AMP ligase [Bryobacterales bacterium]
QAFAEALEPAGFDPKAFLPSYGMAEMSLAISFAELEAPMKVDRVDRAQYKLAGRAVPSGNPDPQKTRVFVSCGRPLPGHELKVVDREGRTLGEREIGHIWVKGPSMMDGYYRNPEATAEVMREDGFMDTGDMGYLLDGEIVITGRAKDLILYHGRNIWPQDIEWAAEQVEPLRSGDVAAFALEGDGGHEKVIVLAQCRLKDPEEMEDLRTRISAAVHRAVGVECDIVLVPPKSLPFTSSGKLSRSKARAMFLAGEILPLQVPGNDGAELQAAVNA